MSVVWGDQLCVDCRSKVADGIFDDDPTCLDCADRRLDRMGANDLNPEFSRTLPPMLDRWTGDGYV